MKKTIIIGLLLMSIVVGCINGTEEGYFIGDYCDGYDWIVDLGNESYTLDCTVCDFKYRIWGKQRYMEGCKESVKIQD